MARRNVAALAAAVVVIVLGFGNAKGLDIGAQYYADTMLASMSIQRQFASTLPSLSDYSQTAHRQTNGNGTCVGETCILNDHNWVMWDTPFLVYDYRKPDDGRIGYDTYSSGFATGIGRLFGPNLTLGLAVGYDARKVIGRDTDDGVLPGGDIRGRAEAFHSALYGGYAYGCFFLDGYAGYSYSRQRSENEFFGVGSNYGMDIFSAGLKASYVIGLPGKVRFVPSVGVDYSHVRQRAFAEYNKPGRFGSAGDIDSSTYDNVQVPIMASLNRTFRAGFLNSLWTPEVRAGWIPQFGSKNAEVGGTVPGGGFEFADSSSDRASSYGIVGAGLKIQIRDKYIFGVDYDYMFASGRDKHMITGTYGVGF